MNVKSFGCIKNMLTFELSLTHFNLVSEIIVASNARDYGIGAVICPKFKDVKIKAVAHAHRTLKTAENIIKSKMKR